jgi:hypothetical protein
MPFAVAERTPERCRAAMSEAARELGLDCDIESA